MDDVPLHIDQVDRLAGAGQRGEESKSGKGPLGIIPAQAYTAPLDSDRVNAR
jgi:hypothetical protein